MKFFNLDLHIGVIGDIKHIMQDMGHTVVDWTMSAHAWVLGRTRDPVDVITHQNWREIDQEMCDAFYERYKYELAEFDAFIVTHTPCFAMLYKRWNKPIITVASTRYEHPFTTDVDKWLELNEHLVSGIDNGKIIPVANNKYDSAYAELFTQRNWPVIPSLCQYTGMRYNPAHKESLYWSKYKLSDDIKALRDKDSFRPGFLQKVINRTPFLPHKFGFEWRDIAMFSAVAHLPYNASIMSMFEQYTANIPLLVPTHRFMMQLYKERKPGVLSELSFFQVLGVNGSSPPQFGKMIHDPNNYSNDDAIGHWITKADYYDPKNMPFVQMYDSFDHLSELLVSTNFLEISEKMASFNVDRKHAIYSTWERVVQQVGEAI